MALDGNGLLACIWKQTERVRCAAQGSDWKHSIRRRSNPD